MSATNDILSRQYNPYSRREDAPLPPVPSSTASNNKQYPYDDVHEDTRGQPYQSNVTSPFSDNTYPSYPKASQQQQQYGAANDYFDRTPSPFPPGQEQQYHDGRNQGYYNHQADPFDDRNAIPLRQQKPGGNTAYGGEDGMGGQPQYHEDERRRRHSTKRRKKGWFAKPIPYVVYTLTVIQIVVFIAEIIRNAVLTKSPIAIKPQFNPMIGPSQYVLINMGARYIPCMKNVQNVTNSPLELFFPCPDTTTATASCLLSELCGFGGVPNPRPNGLMSDRPQPNQWYRFIVPIFLHAGLIHIGFNLLLQMTMGKEMEQLVGSIRFFLIYFSSGIFGFVLGGNFAASGIASTGASGSIFGILALTLLDLLYHWRERRSPVKELIFILLDVAIAFVLGLLPGLDNFSHIGGFFMGLVLGICILRSPAALQQRISAKDSPYAAVASGALPGAAAPTPSHTPPPPVDARDDQTGIQKFARQPVGFFKGRKPFWWAWWILRASALAFVLSVFIVLITRFYDLGAKPCGWCKYLSCLNINNWCDLGNLKFVPNETNGTTPARRALGVDGYMVYGM